MDNMKNYFCSPAMDRLLSQHILRVDEMPHVGLYGGKLGLIIYCIIMHTSIGISHIRSLQTG